MDAATEILIHALIHDADHHIRREAQKLLENRQGPKVLDALIRSLDDEDNLIRWHAPTALSRQGTAAIPALVAALSHPDAFVRRDAVTALGEIGDETVAPACRTLLKDDDRKVRIEAMKTVEKLGGRTPTQTD
jgi:HEAT repeat protein